MTHHRRGLRRLLRDDALLEALEEDHGTARIDERQHEMLRYVEKLTRTPDEVEADDVERLRRAGFADADVLAIVECAAYYAYVNRIASGLGVPLES